MKITNIEKKQVDIIRESLAVYEKWLECKGLFHGRELCFTDVETFIDDRGKSHLFHLKEMSHELFRSSKEAHYKERLFDMTVGYIFHEAMKLRENTYQLEYYRPQCDIKHHRLTDQEKKIVHEIDTLVNKAEIRLREGFKEIRTLLNDLIGQVRDLIVLYRNNYLLPRFIFENEKSFVRIYGKKGFAGLLNALYSDGRQILVYKAGESYLESQYYTIARQLFKRAIHLGADTDRTTFLYLYASAYHFYWKNMFTRALMLAEKAAATDTEEKLKSAYGDGLKHIITDASREIKRQKRL